MKANANTSQSLCCMYTEKMDVDEDSEQNSDLQLLTGPHCAVGSVSDCRFRGCEFDPNLVPYLWELIMEIFLRSFSSLQLNHSRRKGCCQLQAKVCAQSTGLPLVQACPGKKVWLCEMTVLP